MTYRSILRLIPALFIVFVATATISLARAQEPVPSDASSIAGRVLYTDGRPVPSYPVEFRSVEQLQERNNVRTDADGNYVIQGIAAGEYFVGFFHPSRLPPDRNPEVASVPELSPGLPPEDAPVSRRVTVAAGERITDIDFILVDTGAERIAPETIDTGTDTEVLPATGNATVPSSTSRPHLAWFGAAVMSGLGCIAAAYVIARAARDRAK